MRYGTARAPYPFHHSLVLYCVGVKLCRWTKGMLRGRGGCYKHTFYGISSYQCMEMTPSLVRREISCTLLVCARSRALVCAFCVYVIGCASFCMFVYVFVCVYVMCMRVSMPV